MKKIKSLLLFGILVFTFSSCNKCVECTHDDHEWGVYNEDDNDYDEFGDQITEICSDNFESKKEFNDYIEALEASDNDIECKSDFWN